MTEVKQTAVTPAAIRLSLAPDQELGQLGCFVKLTDFFVDWLIRPQAAFSEVNDLLFSANKEHG